MPFYHYYSEETEEEKEVFHGINEEPEVFDSEGNKMKRTISASNFVMGKNNKDSTRNTSIQKRHGHKKTHSSKTPFESSRIKAEEKVKERESASKKANDPYYEHR